MRGPLTCLVFLLVFLPLVPWPGASTARSAASEIFVARIQGDIDRRAAGYVSRVVSEAEEQGAAAVVLEIDTPGGSLDATQKIVRTESNAEGVPVVTYVTPRGARAASAGTFVVMGSDVAAMAPQTRLGAAHPVLSTGADIEGAMGEKVTNDAAALMVGLADAHGRDEAWAESAVRESAALDAAEALELEVVEHVEPDLDAVLARADGTRVEPKGLTLRTRGATIVQKPPSFEERTGISSYLLWTLAGIAALAVALAAIGYWRMIRGRVTTGAEGMIGEVGTLRRPVVEGVDGLVFVHGERWRAVPEKPEYLPMGAGTRVEVVALREGAVVVRPAGQSVPEEG
jgi:membrane-bound serine protease (ClpP class)